MNCPDCGGLLIQGAAKIEGTWRLVWLCDCVPTQEQIKKWDEERAQLIKQHSGMTAREVVKH